MFIVTGYPFLRFVVIIFINGIFLGGGLVQFRNSVEFLIDFWELGYFKKFLPYSLRGRESHFSNELWYLGCLTRSWMNFGKLRPTQGHAAVVTCQPFGLGRDNFIGIRVVDFLNSFTVFFSSPVDVGNSFVNYLTPIWIWTTTLFCKQRWIYHHIGDVVVLDGYPWRR